MRKNENENYLNEYKTTHYLYLVSIYSYACNGVKSMSCWIRFFHVVNLLFLEWYCWNYQWNTCMFRFHVCICLWNRVASIILHLVRLYDQLLQDFIWRLLQLVQDGDCLFALNTPPPPLSHFYSWLLLHGGINVLGNRRSKIYVCYVIS